MVELSVEGDVPSALPPVAADAERVLEILQLEACELSILLCDDATILPLNRGYRKKDRPTDVLSFSQLAAPPLPGEAAVLGDVVISVETAARQAKEQGHSLEKEIRILLVHGICHLLGYDHERDDEALVMEAKEGEILKYLAVLNV
jgi:probable rRNA maturation factor